MAERYPAPQAGDSLSPGESSSSAPSDLVASVWVSSPSDSTSLSGSGDSSTAGLVSEPRSAGTLSSSSGSASAPPGFGSPGSLSASGISPRSPVCVGCSSLIDVSRLESEGRVRRDLPTDDAVQHGQLV